MSSKSIKKFVPIKHIIFLFILFIFLPLSIALTIIYLLELNKILIAICIFLFACPIIGIVILVIDKTNIEIDLVKNLITNNIQHPGDDWNWSENIREIKNIEKIIVNKEMKERIVEKKFIFKNFLVIECINNDKKYISISLFTKKQIKKIINIINDIKSKIEKSIQ